MSSRKLLIIGNGFDIAHGLPTKWEHFKEYIDWNIQSNKDSTFCTKEFEEMLEKYEKDMKDLHFWSDVEGFLGELGTEIEDKEDLTNLSSFIDEFILLFQRYLCKVEIELFDKVKINNDTIEFLNGFDKIITTNYTNTLEKLYDIPVDKITHIHGQIVEESDDTITCIIGCDNNEFKRPFFPSISPRKIKKSYIEDPKALCSSGISKFGRTMMCFNTIPFMNKNCNLYTGSIEELKCIGTNKSYKEEKSYETICIWGYSFGISDFIMNDIITEQIRRYDNNINSFNVITYKMKPGMGIYNDEVQELIEDKLGYNSTNFDNIIHFSNEYVEEGEPLKLGMLQNK